MYEGLETHFKRQSEIEKSGAYIKPKSFSLGTALEDRVENGCVVKVPVNLIGQFIEFRYVLKGFLELPGVFDEILTYVRHLEFGDKFVLPLSFSYDDYETNKELGTHTGVYNMGAGCICISCLPPKFRSQLENIFLVLLIHAGDRVKGNAETFRKVIDELKYLEEEGISVVTSDGNVTVYFALALVYGDNKGANGVLGFVESFSRAKHYCRICFENIETMKKQVVADPAKRRTCETYEHDLVVDNASLTGRKGECVFNELKFFHVSENVHVDTMHDLDEGVWKYLMYDVVFYLYRQKRFSIDYLNEIIQGFSYGPNEMRNKPPLISHDDLTKHKRIRFNANEFRCFLRYFGLMFGHLVKDEDKDVWNLYLIARQIQDIVTAPKVFSFDIPVLRQLIMEHHTEYMRLFEKDLKPKFHFMVHEPEILELLGPLDPISTYRSEAKYKEGSDVAQKSHNRINLPFTIAKRHQLKLAFRFLSGRGLVPKFEYTALHCVPVQSVKNYDKFSHVIPADRQGVWNCVNKLKVNGAQYYLGAVVLLSLRPDNLPVFGSICVISLPDDSLAFLVVQKLEIIRFDRHVHAYEVKMGNQWHFVEIDTLLHFWPTHVRFINNVHHVSYRCSVSTFAKSRVI
ncbi:hypothetical protein ONE63_007296 [Megalurothrips usitatus]|uniref:Uncharacterized protein n=1 Tax=Megalurothrips usitatus TaxID=439358 RepID=A0AAV7XSD4_9NEOP|nr:hypothetical protein ONE63_007296 [Megalurothrips usitatus]